METTPAQAPPRMKRRSYDYRTSVRWTGERNGLLESDGKPDILTGCEVSAMSDANLANPREALGDDGVTVTRGVLIDVVEGNCEFAYRRYAATWLMVTPFDDPWNYDRGDEFRRRAQLRR